jgi:tetratricopeptide (TPR) repeat protein
LLREAIDIRRRLVNQFPDNPGYKKFLMRTAQPLGRLLRDQAGKHLKQQHPEEARELLDEAEALYAEAIDIGRQTHADPSYLVNEDFVGLLQDESLFLLTRGTEDGDKISSKAKAKNLLDEAIGTCRQLIADFPNHARFRQLLTGLLSLQSRHFGPMNERLESSAEQPR